MNVIVQKTPLGFQAYDDDTADFAPDSEWPHNCIGHGRTEQEAIDDLCAQMEQPYWSPTGRPKCREYYGNDSLDRKLHVARAYLRYRLSLARCKAAQIDSMARLQRLVDQEAVA